MISKGARFITTTSNSLGGVLSTLATSTMSFRGKQTDDSFQFFRRA
jgi:hypothetical protein